MFLGFVFGIVRGGGELDLVVVFGRFISIFFKKYGKEGGWSVVRE